MSLRFSIAILRCASRRAEEPKRAVLGSKAGVGPTVRSRLNRPRKLPQLLRWRIVFCIAYLAHPAGVLSGLLWSQEKSLAAGTGSLNLVTDH
jgi:hypothetical protein